MGALCAQPDDHAKPNKGSNNYDELTSNNDETLDVGAPAPALVPIINKNQRKHLFTGYTTHQTYRNSKHLKK